MSHRSLKLHAGYVRDFSGLVSGDVVEFKTLQRNGRVHSFIRVQEDYAKQALLVNGLAYELEFLDRDGFLVWIFKIVKCKE